MENDGPKLTNGNESKSKNLLSDYAPAGRGRRLERNDEKTNLSFSFKYFKQIPYFQLGQQDNHWFVSLLERLSDLSGKDSSILADPTAKSNYRIHPVSWHQPRIPIKKTDLNWIPKAYLQNEEIEFLQFEISKSNGRVVGFFNENSEVFYIVLLDPKHNIQPTKATGYRVDNTCECLTDYEELLQQLKKCQKQKEFCKDPEICPITFNIMSKHLVTANRMIWLDDELVSIFEKFGIKEMNGMLEQFLLEKL